MLESALRYPATDDGVATILVGGLLTLLAWLVVPAVALAGYFQRVLARTTAGEPAPRFDEWGDLLRTGLLAVAVTLAYWAVPTAFLLAALAGLLVFSVETTVGEESAVTDPGPLVDAAAGTDPATVADPVTSVGPDPLSVVVVLGGLALALVTSLAAWYALPAALARLAVEDRFAEAFEVRALAGVLASGSYLTGWLVALVVLLVGGALAGGLASVPVVGWALAPFVGFYVGLVAVVLYGRAYCDATGPGRRDRVEGDRGAST